ncbi:MAG TPA: hypothetical protein VH165_28730 [Kofleriaceae bacterium]|jgi:hypothetical protein|nr:hypothetical protein [Kofleriaceae bacterium]
MAGDARRKNKPIGKLLDAADLRAVLVQLGALYELARVELLVT